MSDEKTVLLSIKLDTGDLKKNSEEASKKLEELKTKQAILRGENKQGTAEYAKLSAEIKAQNQILTQSSKAIEINDRLGNKQNLTLKEQSELLSAGKVALRNLTTEEIANTEAGQQLNKEVNDLNESLKKSEKAYGDNQREVGNYDKGIRGLKAELKDLKSQMVGLDAGSKEYQQASEKAGVLGDKIKEVNENVKASSGGTGFEKLSNNLGLVQDDLMNLDFAGVSEKMKQMAVISKAMTFKEVIGGVKNMGSALLALGRVILMNPLFLMVGVIVAIAGALKMWSDTVNEQAIKAQDAHTASIQRNIDKMIAQNKKREEISALELKLLELDGAGAKKIADKKTKDLYQSEAERLALIEKYQEADKQLRSKFRATSDNQRKTDINKEITDNNSLLKELGESFTGYKEKRLILEKENSKDIREENKKSKAEILADEQTAEQKKLDFLYKLADLQLANEDKANANSYKRAEIKYNALLNDANNSAEDLLQIQKDYNTELDRIDEEAKKDDIAKSNESKKREIKSAEGNQQLLTEIDRKYVLEKTAINKDYETKKNERDAKSITDTELYNKAKVNSEKKATQELKSINAELNYLKSKGTIDEQKMFEAFQQSKIDVLTSNAEEEIRLSKLTGDAKLAVETKLALDTEKINKEEFKKTEEKTVKETEKKLTDEQEKQQKIATVTLNSAVQLTDAISQIQQSKIQNELTDEKNKNDEKNKFLKEQLDANLITEAEYNNQKSAIDAEYKANESKLKTEAFKKEKEANLIKAIMNTANGVAGALPNIPLSILAGVLGAVQVSLIASQPIPKFAKGGVFGGNSHSNGGTTGVFSDGTQIEVERDENFYILNKNASKHINGLSNLNQQFGGIPLMANGGAVTSSGIMATSIANEVDANLNAQNQMMRMIELMPKPVVIVQDINDAQGNLATVENRANF
ncbi:hypothetical protein UFOVP600_6 [uncultured Caudovirales phage]|uniref:Uncharacterized protein n=1 Tax=uncultured Caudovirales phage TaxID=2100421 RepID=A0A6J5N673_9CAUD|nr:hypothetical protein UFOVP600_6 [uncultured Caudovirales phage]